MSNVNLDKWICRDIGYEPCSIVFLFGFFVVFVSFLHKGRFSAFFFPVDEKLMVSH